MIFGDKNGVAPFTILAVEDYPTLRIIRLRGSIDNKAVAELEKFRKWVTKHSGFKHKHVLLDFKQVSHLDTAAVAEIIQHVQELKAIKFSLAAININDHCQSMFQVLKVQTLVTVYKNESDALKDLQDKK